MQKEKTAKVYSGLHTAFLISLLCTFVCMISCTSTSLVAAKEPMPTFESFTGFIAYPNNLYFPSRIKVEIAFQAIDRFSTNIRVLTMQTIRNPQRFPLGFIIRYAPTDIKAGDTHVLSVKVYQENAEEPYLVASNYRVDLSLRDRQEILITLTPPNP